MAREETFIEEFKVLLDQVSDEFSLPQWQYLYRQVIFTMGIKILEKFPSEVIGWDPCAASNAEHHRREDKQKGGGHPSVICQFTGIVLGGSSTPD